MIIYELFLLTKPEGEDEIHSSLGFFKTLESIEKYVNSEKFKTLLSIHEECITKYIGWHSVEHEVKS